MKAPRVTLDQWRTLQAVVDHGGFAQAAEALHRSQSSVSYTVARMQEQLGAPLLRIEGRKAVLTEAGEVLLRRSRQLVKQASQLEELAHHMEQGWEAEVRLVVDAAYPTANIVRTLSAFMPQSRGCRVRLREEVLSGVEDVLHEGSADLAISALNITGYLPIELGEVDFIAVAHPEHPLHRLQREVTFQDLEGQMQVVIRDSGRVQPRDAGWLGAEGTGRHPPTALLPLQQQGPGTRPSHPDPHRPDQELRRRAAGGALRRPAAQRLRPASCPTSNTPAASCTTRTTARANPCCWYMAWAQAFRTGSTSFLTCNNSVAYWPSTCAATAAPASRASATAWPPSPPTWRR